jgi:RNA polymerase sigma-70 factor (ECF subfamily)
MSKKVHVFESGFINDDNFEEIYLHYFPRLLRFAAEYVGEMEEAENIAQDVFLQLWEKRGIWEIHTSLNAFLFLLTKNKCLDYLRHKVIVEAGNNRMQEDFLNELKMKLYSLEVFDDSLVTKDNTEEIIRKAIDSLPEKCREIIIMSKIEGKKHKEIAKQLNISVNTVENQISIALKKLRIKLKNYYPFLLFLGFF